MSESTKAHYALLFFAAMFAVGVGIGVATGDSVLIVAGGYGVALCIVGFVATRGTP